MKINIKFGRFTLIIKVLEFIEKTEVSDYHQKNLSLVGTRDTDSDFEKNSRKSVARTAQQILD